ncbi:MAG: MG2 domain-containing protein, partial [Bacteroidales bacterium]|nr:MG2 domain-containing protein [Bacteroidales bacterium]
MKQRLFLLKIFNLSLNYKIKTIVLVFLFILFNSLTLIHSQVTDTLNMRYQIERVQDFMLNQHEEKLFIHTDRPVYQTGEDIWFKAYLLTAANDKPELLEKILYLELIDSKGELVLKRVFELDHGTVSSAFPVPMEVPQGQYLLVAYTNWMKNKRSGNVFEKNLYVVNNEPTDLKLVSEMADSNIQTPELKDSLAAETCEKKKKAYQVSFYPEGGDLIAGIPSVVAFEAMDTLGKGIPVVGTIYDENKKKISTFNSIDQGRGCFSIKPGDGQRFHALVEINNKTIRFDLPEVKTKGFVLNVLNRYRSDRLIVQVSTNDTSAIGKFFLVASQRGIIRSCIESETSSKGRILKLDKDKFKTGIVQLIVVDQFLNPQAERLVYVNHHDNLSIEIQPSKTEYSKRQEILADIIVKDANNKPVQGDFSIAVTDLGQINPSFYKEDMYDYMKLACDFPEAKNSLTNMLGDSRRAHVQLDLVMLTKGWRRFSWYPKNEELNDKLDYQLEQYNYLTTSLQKRRSGKSVRNMDVKVLTFQNAMPDTYQGKTDKNGQFKFELLSFTDTVKLIVQTANGMDVKKDVFINLESNLPFINELYTPKKNRMTISRTNKVGYNFFSPIAAGELEAVPNVLNSYVKPPKETRQLDLGLPTDSLNILIKEVDIVANKKKTKREEMTRQYGSPSVVINERQIEAIHEQTSWASGLIELLFDQFPELNISIERASQQQLYGREQEQNTSINALLGMRQSEVGGDSIDQPDFEEFDIAGETIRFQLTRGGERRFIVCFDGKAVATSNHEGFINRVTHPYHVDDIITFDPQFVKSVELITDLKKTPGR